MTMRASLLKTVKVGGKTFTQNVNYDSDVAVVVEKSVAAAKTGTLSTRTDSDTGVLTMQASHGIATSDLLDVYWNGGSRRRMTVGTVSGTSVPIDGGTGDNLPLVTTAITAMVPVVENVLVDPDNMTTFAAGGNKVRTAVCCKDGSANVIFDKTIPANRVIDWYTGNGDTIPVSGSAAVATVLLSHEDSTKAHTIKTAFTTA